MKKFVILSAFLALSACACMDDYDDEQEPVVYKTTEPREMNCDYFDGKTCYRYVRRTRQVVAPVVRYREVAPRPCPQVQYVQSPAVVAAPCNSCNACGTQVSETREPVEVTYKKTTYTTTYEPKVTSTVNYERVPYNAAQNVQLVQPQAQVVQSTVQTVAAPQAEVVVPASGEEVLLNVK